MAPESNPSSRRSKRLQGGVRIAGMHTVLSGSMPRSSAATHFPAPEDRCMRRLVFGLSSGGVSSPCVVIAFCAPNSESVRCSGNTR